MEATKVCTSHGKKTLNIDHILEALKLINFNSHIKKLQGELDFNKLENEEINLRKKETNGGNLEESSAIGMKDLINKKRKNKKDKKTFEFSEDMINEQMQLFEKSKMENMPNILMRGTPSANLNNINSKENAVLKDGNKKLKLDNVMEKSLFANEKKTIEEEVDFD